MIYKKKLIYFVYFALILETRVNSTSAADKMSVAIWMY